MFARDSALCMRTWVCYWQHPSAGREVDSPTQPSDSAAVCRCCESTQCPGHNRLRVMLEPGYERRHTTCSAVHEADACPHIARGIAQPGHVDTRSLSGGLCCTAGSLYTHMWAVVCTSGCSCPCCSRWLADPRLRGDGHPATDCFDCVFAVDRAAGPVAERSVLQTVAATAL